MHPSIPSILHPQLMMSAPGGGGGPKIVGGKEPHAALPQRMGRI
jgi:hypothetical protein